LKSRDGSAPLSLAFSPDGETIATCGEHGTLYQWRPLESSDPRAVRIGAGDLHSIAYSQDGRFIAVASTHSNTAPKDDFIAVVRPRDGRLMWRANAHPGGASCVAFSAGGKELVSSGLDETIKRWRVNSDA